MFCTPLLSPLGIQCQVEESRKDRGKHLHFENLAPTEGGTLQDCKENSRINTLTQDPDFKHPAELLVLT